MFRFMEKYRVHILLIVLIGMVGFGAWGFLVDFFRDDGREEIDPSEVWASFELNGQEEFITLEDIAQRTRGYGFSGDENDAARLIGSIVRERLADSKAGMPVATEELEKALETRLIDPMRRANDGQFSPTMYADFTGNNFGMTPERFEGVLLGDLEMAKSLRELDRAGNIPNMSRIIETARREHQRIKIKAVVWDSRNYEDEAKLPRDENGNLTGEAIKTLLDYYQGLEEDEKRALNSKGGLFSTEFIGFDFSNFESEQDLLDAFAEPSETSGKSLDELISGIEVSEDDVNIFKRRLRSRRDAYELGSEVEVDEHFEQNKVRYEREIRLLKHMQDLFAKLDDQIKAGAEVDLKKVASDNNLTHFVWRDRYLIDFIKETGDFQSGSVGILQNATVNVGQLASMPYAGTEVDIRYGNGPIDEPGRFVAIYKLLERDMTPIPAFSEPELRETLIARYEKEQAESMRDAALERFEDRMTEICSEKAADEIAKIRSETEEAIAEERKELEEELAAALKDLDPEADKEKIDELEKANAEQIELITEEKNEEAEIRIEEAREPFRSEAFDQILNEMPDVGLVVQEGFFRPFDAVNGEGVVDRDAGFEAIARSAVRRDVRALHDDARLDRYVDVGTVTPTLDAPTYPGVKMVAKLVDKRKPTDEELLLRPNLLRTAEMTAGRKIGEERGARDFWSYEAMQERNFDLDPGKFAEAIEEAEKRRLEIEAQRKKWEAENLRSEEEVRKAKTGVLNTSAQMPGESSVTPKQDDAPGEAPTKAPADKPSDEPSDDEPTENDG